ncbi:uncharacterized protein LOC103313487 [Tribolium castaneum]|uniref:uncharacterized protein LOC103313487 n=1 Tax=Tribolium castaneum TaxID=7070 RepID=UPI00046C1FD6|nr:PREDICTED: uncharacterized protein LOC103313487 [Tribolium castaneum]XP_015839721.1 PREDICTED: uncharacterized protein LOC103313487 [Tribolium castaneum]|eukprot:XP_015839720.1 PREDICTED: uncharacterized protein LOC103313487 [Tribolium castaneum]
MRQRNCAPRDQDLARSQPKSSVVSSTPMPFSRHKNFLPNASNSVSPITVVKPGNVTKPAKASTSANSRTKLFKAEISTPITDTSIRSQRLENIVLSLHRSLRAEPVVNNQRLDKNASTMSRKNANIFETTDKMMQTSNNNSLTGAKKLARSRRSNCDLSFSRNEELHFEKMVAEKRLADLIDKLEDNFLKRPPVESRMEENFSRIGTGVPWRVTIVPHENVALNANTLLAFGSSDEESFDDTFLPKMRPKPKVLVNKKKLKRGSGRFLKNATKNAKQSKLKLDERSMTSSVASEVPQTADQGRMKSRAKGKEKERVETLIKEPEENPGVKNKKRQSRSGTKSQTKHNVLDANHFQEVTSNSELFTERFLNEENKKVESTRKRQKKRDRTESPLKKLRKSDINDSKSGKQNMTQDDGEMVSYGTNTDNWRNDLFGESSMKEMEHLEKGNKSGQSLKKEKKKQNASPSKKQKAIVKCFANKNKEHSVTDDSGFDESQRVSVKAVVHARATQKNSKKPAGTQKQQLRNVDNIHILEDVMTNSDEETSRKVEIFFESNNQDTNFGAPNLDNLQQLRTITKKPSLNNSVNKSAGKSTARKTQNKEKKKQTKHSTTKSKAQSTTGITETTTDETTGCMQRRSGRQRKQTKIYSAGYILCTERDRYYKVATAVRDISQVTPECSFRLSGLQKRRTRITQMPPIMEPEVEMEGNTQKSKRKTKKPAKKQSSKKLKKDETPKRQETRTVSESETNLTRSDYIVGENVITSDYVSAENVAQNTQTPFVRLEEVTSRNIGSEELHNTVFSSPPFQAQESIKKNSVISGRISKRSSTKTSAKKTRDSLKKVVETQRDSSGNFMICPATNELIRYSFKNLVYKPSANLPGVMYAVTEDLKLGWLKISGGMSKPLFKTKNHTMSFVVVEGKAEVGIQDKCDLYKKHDIFIVPQGAEYYINNKNKTNPLLLVFFKVAYADKPT